LLNSLRKTILLPILEKGAGLAVLGKKYTNNIDTELMEFLRFKSLEHHYLNICAFFLSQIDIQDGHLEVFEDLFNRILDDQIINFASNVDADGRVVVIDNFTSWFYSIIDLCHTVFSYTNDKLSVFGKFSFSTDLIVGLEMMLNEFLKHSTQDSDKKVSNSILQIVFDEFKNQSKYFTKNDNFIQSSTAKNEEFSIKEEKVKKINPSDDNPSLNEVLEELNSLIGMEQVKKDVLDTINFIRVQLMRKKMGLPTIPSSYHIVFTGNPGTGKTTVARLIGRIYKEIGVLSSGHTIETDRADLVSEHIGGTAIKTNKKIQEAMGGVLFIDEAYSLTRDKSGQDFGKEAVDTLVKRMEDFRDKFAVIVAGYGEEMKEFISSNPGLKSRFTKYIHFDDYTPEELLAIFKKLCKDYQSVPTEEALRIVYNHFKKQYRIRGETSSNGRMVRTLFEKTMRKQSNRVIQQGLTQKSEITKITKEDIVLN
jgi:stage V sporulation protein K